jgi:hypothetical protein
VDTDALIERYRKEIEELKQRLAEKEADAPVRSRRLSAREVCLSPLQLGSLGSDLACTANRRVKGHEGPQRAHTSADETDPDEPERGRDERG